MTEVIKNKTEGYGYKYASLADMVEQGVVIPKMRTTTDSVTHKDYFEYYDPELKEWQRGSEIKVPQNKGMNDAQLLKSAYTYARRATTEMALGLACGDDEIIEDTDENGNSKTKKPATQKQIDLLLKLYEAPMIARMLQYYKAETLQDLTAEQASEAIDKKMKNTVISINEDDRT